MARSSQPEVITINSSSASEGEEEVAAEEVC